jgi:hypothetical protein
MTKIKTFKNGAWTFIERVEHSGAYVVKCYLASGALYDKVICDTYRGACEYLRCFNAIAKQS